MKAGQFLLQIDPVVAEAAVRRDEAAVAGARTALEQSRVSLQSARASLELARQALKRQQELNAGGLTTRENIERAQAEVEVRESDLHAREEEIKNRETQLHQQEAGLQSSRHTLTQVRFDAPFDGIVTRRNIEEGENVVVGTMAGILRHLAPHLVLWRLLRVRGDAGADSCRGPEGVSTAPSSCVVGEHFVSGRSRCFGSLSPGPSPAAAHRRRRARLVRRAWRPRATALALAD